MHKILILMCYYNRPNLVRFALESVRTQSYKNWEIVFVDDGSDISAIESAKEILKEDFSKLRYINTQSSIEEKRLNGGSVFGWYWSQACRVINADIGIMLCDDDALAPDYLANLDSLFALKPEINWCHSWYYGYDPYVQKDFDNIIINRESPKHTHNLNPDSLLDASQVAWRLTPFKNEPWIEFGYPMTANLDSDLYRKLYPIFGDCVWSGVYGQFKGIQQNRLEERQKDNRITYSKNIDIDIIPFKKYITI